MKAAAKRKAAAPLLPALRASSLPRLAACPGSAALPQVKTASSPQAAHGTAVHAYLEAAMAGKSEEALAAMTDEAMRAACDAIPLDRLPTMNGTGWQSEVAMALNPATGQACRPAVRDGKYLVGSEWIAGTTDCLHHDEATRTVTVVDYKTGAEVDAAEVNRQVRFYAVAAARLYGATAAVVVLVYVRGGSVKMDSATMDSMDIDAEEAALADLMNTVQTQTADAPQLATGLHCKYCPARWHCPARGGEVAALVARPGGFMPVAGMVELTPAAAGAAWVKIKSVMMALEAMQENLKMLAESVPLPLPNGKVLMAQEASRETINAELAEPLLAGMIGTAAAAAAVEVKHTMTKVALKAAVKSALAEGEKLGKRLEEVEAALAEGGAISTTYYSKITECDEGSRYE